MTPEPDENITILPPIADSTILLANLRAFFADARTDSAPTDAELQSIATIGANRNDTRWLDSTLTERCGQSPTEFRAAQRDARQTFRENQSVRSNLGLATAATPALTPVPTPPPPTPSLSTDSTHRNCGSCAERLARSSFSALTESGEPLRRCRWLFPLAQSRMKALFDAVFDKSLPLALVL